MTTSILDHPVISERYFFPRSDFLDCPTNVAVDGAVLGCYVRAPHQNGPLLVHFHGNGEVVGDYLPDWADAFVERGINVFLAEYRGYGSSTGDPTLVRMLDDVTPIYEAAKTVSSPVFVYGRSVGSIYALELAKRHPQVAGLILESGIADPLERILLRVTPSEIGSTDDKVAAEAARHLDHKGKLSELRSPVLVFHARYDHLVDVSHGARLASWAGEDAEFVCFDRGDHNSILACNGLDIVSKTAEFISAPRPEHG